MVTGRLMSGLGKTEEEVDAMGWPGVVNLLDYWRDWPPTNEVARLVAIRVGVSRPSGPKKYATREEIAALAHAMEGMNGG